MSEETAQQFSPGLPKGPFLGYPSQGKAGGPCTIDPKQFHGDSDMLGLEDLLLPIRSPQAWGPWGWVLPTVRAPSFSDPLLALPVWGLQPT